MLRTVHRNQTGAVLPILMMTSSLMVISGVAFLGVSSYEAKMSYNGTVHLQAKYEAEKAVKKAIWRIENSPPSEWPTLATFDDTTSIAVFDTTTMTVMVSSRQKL